MGVTIVQKDLWAHVCRAVHSSGLKSPTTWVKSEEPMFFGRLFPSIFDPGLWRTGDLATLVTDRTGVALVPHVLGK